MLSKVNFQNSNEMIYFLVISLILTYLIKLIVMRLLTHRTLEYLIIAITIHSGTRDQLLMLTRISKSIKFESGVLSPLSNLIKGSQLGTFCL